MIKIKETRKIVNVERNRGRTFILCILKAELKIFRYLSNTAARDQLSKTYL